MESVFEVIAEPNRRDIELPGLVTTVAWRDRALASYAAAGRAKQLRVLREGGFVESTVDAQHRLDRLKPGPLQAVDAWLAQFRGFRVLPDGTFVSMFRIAFSAELPSAASLVARR
jgi:hypothetical protein